MEGMNSPETLKEDEVRSIRFIIPGVPFGKQRPRVTVKKYTGNDGEEKRFAKAYTPEKTVNYENLVKMAYKEEAKGKNRPGAPPARPSEQWRLARPVVREWLRWPGGCVVVHPRDPFS